MSNRASTPRDGCFQERTQGPASGNVRYGPIADVGYRLNLQSSWNLLQMIPIPADHVRDLNAGCCDHLREDRALKGQIREYSRLNQNTVERSFLELVS